MFWRLVSKDISLLFHQEDISFIDIQKANAILDMNESYENVTSGYQDKKHEDMMKNMSQNKTGKRF